MAGRALALPPISTSVSPFTKTTAAPSLLIQNNVKGVVLTNSLVGNCSLQLLSSGPVIHRRRRSATKVLFTLPTAKPDRAPAEKIPKWSARAIKSFAMAELEARKLKYPTTGTEALLMGILVEGTSFAARCLRANGITLFKVREETIKLLGKSDLYFFSPEHPPLTEPAQRALDFAIDEKMKSGEGGEVTTTLIVLGIWAEKDSAGHKLMAAHGFDEEKAKELAKFTEEDAVLTYR